MDDFPPGDLSFLLGWRLSTTSWISSSRSIGGSPSWWSQDHPGWTWLVFLVWIPSGKLTFCYGKSPFLMGKSSISMAIFNSKLLNYQRVKGKGLIQMSFFSIFSLDKSWTKTCSKLFFSIFFDWKLLEQKKGGCDFFMHSMSWSCWSWQSVAVNGHDSGSDWLEVPTIYFWPFFEA